MNKKKLKRLVTARVFHSEYDATKDPKIDWEQWKQDFRNEPGVQVEYIKNECRVNYLRQEEAYLDNQIHLMSEAMETLETAHEKWEIQEDETVIRCRDSRSIEGTSLLEGVTQEGDGIEDWLVDIYNCMITYRYNNNIDLAIATKGQVGEFNVQETLAHSKYAGNVIHNVVLDVADEGGQTNEIDTYVILSCGIVVIETKNYGNEDTLLRVTDDDMWDLIAIDSDYIIRKEKNPQYQNSRHIKATRKKIRQLWDREIPIFGLIVIGNDEVEIENESELDVETIDTLISYLDHLNSKVHLTHLEREQLKRLLEDSDIGSNAFPVTSYQKQVYHYAEIFRKIYPFLTYNQQAKHYYYARKNKIRFWRRSLIPVVLALILLYSNQSTDIVTILFQNMMEMLHITNNH